MMQDQQTQSLKVKVIITHIWEEVVGRMDETCIATSTSSLTLNFMLENFLLKKIIYS